MAANNQKIINLGLNTLSKLIDSDTETTLIDLQLLYNLNTNQALNYIKLSHLLDTLQENQQKLASQGQEFSNIGKVLEDIGTKVDKLEVITQELDDWSVELAQKVQAKKDS